MEFEDQYALLMLIFISVCFVVIYYVKVIMWGVYMRLTKKLIKKWLNPITYGLFILLIGYFIISEFFGIKLLSGQYH